VEPGDNRQWTKVDTNHHVGGNKRARPTVPPAASNPSSGSSRTNSQSAHRKTPVAEESSETALPSTPSVAVPSPYTSIRTKNTIRGPGAVSGDDRGAVGRSDISACAPSERIVPPDTSTSDTDSTDPVSESSSCVRTAGVRSATASSQARDGHAEWKSKALDSMEKMIKSGATFQGTSASPREEQGNAAGRVSGPGSTSTRSSSDTVTSTSASNKQSTLLSFFTPQPEKDLVRSSSRTT
ncbi:unnamed protein product, partial [Sphacelaria rigidula]